MKINKILLKGLLLAAVTLTSCGGDDDNNNSGGGDSVVILEGNLESRTLTKNTKYLIKGQTFVLPQYVPLYQ